MLLVIYTVVDFSVPKLAIFLHAISCLHHCGFFNAQIEFFYMLLGLLYYTIYFSHWFLCVFFPAKIDSPFKV